MTDALDRYGFETLQIHAGARPDPATGARQTPIYQSTAYVFRDSDQAAALFDLKEIGFIYSRLTNPTVAVLQERIATLEGGVGAVCCASGHAAQLLALFPLMSPGTNVVASNRLYGGTVTQFNNTIQRFNWSANAFGPSADYPTETLRSGNDRRWEATDLAFDTVDRSHWVALYRSVPPGAGYLYYTRVGYTGASLFAPVAPSFCSKR